MNEKSEMLKLMYHAGLSIFLCENEQAEAVDDNSEWHENVLEFQK